MWYILDIRKRLLGEHVLDSNNTLRNSIHFFCSIVLILVNYFQSPKETFSELYSYSTSVPSQLKLLMRTGIKMKL